jgi:hypothetical protein
MNAVMEAGKNIYLSCSGSEKISESKRLPVTLRRAGFSLLDGSQSEQELSQSFCSVHLIGKEYQEFQNGISVSEHHFNEAKKRIATDPEYKSFIWLPGKVNFTDADPRQLDFINRLQNHLSNNMILSKAPSAVQFVEDIKIILEQNPVKVYDTEVTDIFLVCNQLDEPEARRIQLMLADIVKMVKLIIVQDSDIDYEEYAAQQMNVSNISVIYFNKGKEWALPFAQQIWKKVGGASAKSPILLIGDATEISNEQVQFSAPRVTCHTLPLELIPLEIKIRFDELKEK